MSTYLLIAFVIAVALAPLSHFMPSRRQREVAGMREYAAVNGLFVEFRSAPGGDRAPPPPDGELIYYGRRLDARTADRFTRGAWVRDDQGWRPIGERRPVPTALERLPRQVFAAGADAASCGVYWVESGGEEAVATILDVLGEWAESGE